MLDFFENNKECFLSLGKHWYVRKRYGMPFHKKNNIREAIVFAMKLKEETINEGS